MRRAESNECCPRHIHRGFGAFDRAKTATKTIAEVNHAGGLASGSGEVETAFSEYYARLFSPHAYLEAPPPEVTGTLPTVAEDIMTTINEPISVEEVKRAIKKLSKNKLPGPDGIISEFYQALCEESALYWRRSLKTSKPQNCYTLNAEQ